MKIFLGIVLLVVAVISLVKGTIFKGSLLKMKEMSKDFYENYYERDTNTYNKNILLAGVPLVFGMFFFAILELVFYVSVVNNDLLTLPTVFMMLIYTIVASKGALKTNKYKKINKADRVIDKIVKEKADAKKLSEMKTRTFTGTLHNTLSVVYLAYAIMVLISY